jgi:hypothetical protein
MKSKQEKIEKYEKKIRKLQQELYDEKCAALSFKQGQEVMIKAEIVMVEPDDIYNRPFKLWIQPNTNQPHGEPIWVSEKRLLEWGNEPTEFKCFTK